MTTNALTLPDEATFKAQVAAVNRFQQVVHATLVDGHDYGTIPGTQKPTLLKPGAEKIAKLLGLADTYEILDKTEDWSKGFFRYLIRASLTHIASQQTVSQGLGECNSMESRYRWRWMFGSEVPAEVNKEQLATRTINTRNGEAKQYRLENEDIYTLVNTVLKMAKKRALVDAALSAGRLSDVFTQDIEDMAPAGREVVDKAPAGNKHYCATHSTPFVRHEKDGKVWYSHKAGDGWCNEAESKPKEVPANVDTATGEVKPPDHGPADEFFPPAEPAPTETKRMAEASIKTWGDMCNVLTVKYKLTSAQIKTLLKCYDFSQLAIKPAEAYLLVVAAMEAEK